MKRRSLLKFGSMSGALAIAGQLPISKAQAADTGPIKVGVLHSLSGTMAISETSLKDTALMTIAQINASGGVLGPSTRTGGGRPGIELAALRRKSPPTDLARQGAP